MLDKIMVFVFILVITPFAFGDKSGQGPGWMEGYWCQYHGDELTEEIWLPELDSEMLGLARTSKSKQMTSFEYLRMVTVDDVLTYMAQPGGRPATSFAQTKSGEKWIRFENPHHDFPQAIEYRRKNDSLTAEISGPGPDEKLALITVEYSLCE